MYRIAILTDQMKKAQNYANQINRFCVEKGMLPRIELYQNQEHFFEQIQKTEPTSAVIALPGIGGLNVTEHLRSLRPDCGIIWCSDMDFSLHAFKLRIEYFILEPVSDEELQKGLAVWFDRREIGRLKVQSR